jgi:hypothetical protein
MAQKMPFGESAKAIRDETVHNGRVSQAAYY